MAQPNAPHVVIISLSYEIHEKLATGECKGSPTDVGRKLLKIEGINRDDCVKKINEIIQQLST